MRTTYTSKPSRRRVHGRLEETGKVDVYRHCGGLPKSFAGRFRDQASADAWVARSEQEDAEWRLRRVRGYLAERTARPAPAPIEITQGELFA